MLSVSSVHASVLSSPPARHLYQYSFTFTLHSKEFTNKRREILLLNISIKTQQEEIDKLHTDLRAKEASLKAREDSLIKEQKRFDCFLKDLDQSQQSAAAALDEQLKIRKEKEQVVKDLSQEIGIVESGIRQLLADASGEM